MLWEARTSGPPLSRWVRMQDARLQPRMAERTKATVVKTAS
jgi:hypothetical protein